MKYLTATFEDIEKKYGKDVSPLYKEQLYEPLMISPTGHGYQGVVLQDKKQDKIISHLTGKPVQTINTSHVKSHGKALKIKTVPEYKAFFGLSPKIPLVSQAISKQLSERAHRMIKTTKFSSIRFNSETSKQVNEKTREQRIASSRAIREVTSFKNKHGLCQAQVDARLLIVRSIVKEP